MRHDENHNSAGALADTARTIAARVRAALVEHAGGAAGETLEDAADLKSMHDIDRFTARIAAEALAGEPCNVFIEGQPGITREGARFAVYIDPVDGSLNWDRNVGDPSFVFATAPMPHVTHLDALEFAYVEGLRSGDVYTIDSAGRAVFDDARTGQRTVLSCTSPARVRESTGYLRPGYGRAREQIGHTLALYLAARDIRAIDNATIEWCDIARGGADFMVEARGKSDGFNLIAWPILRAAGGAVRTLDGENLARTPFAPEEPIDYIAAGSAALAEDVHALTQRFSPRTREAVDTIARALDG